MHQPCPSTKTEQAEPRPTSCRALRPELEHQHCQDPGFGQAKAAKGLTREPDTSPFGTSSAPAQAGEGTGSVPAWWNQHASQANRPLLHVLQLKGHSSSRSTFVFNAQWRRERLFLFAVNFWHAFQSTMFVGLSLGWRVPCLK